MTATPVSWSSYAEGDERLMRQVMPRSVYEPRKASLPPPSAAAPGSAPEACGGVVVLDHHSGCRDTTRRRDATTCGVPGRPPGAAADRAGRVRGRAGPAVGVRGPGQDRADRWVCLRWLVRPRHRHRGAGLLGLRGCGLV